MHASRAVPEATRSAARATLARDLYAVLHRVMKAGGGDVFRVVGDLELSMTQIKALHVLDLSDEEATVKELAERLGVSMPAMSRSVDGLLHRGFVERREDEEDRRMKQVRITEAGREVPRALHESRLSALHDFLDSLDDEQADRLAAALAPIAARDDIAGLRPKET